MVENELNWPRLRNAIKRRLRHNVEPQDLADAVQEACGFAWIEISENDCDPGLAVWKAVARVKRGHTLCYEPRDSERWEEPDYAGSLFYLTHRPGVGEYSARISRGICPLDDDAKRRQLEARLDRLVAPYKRGNAMRLADDPKYIRWLNRVNAPETGQ